MNFEDVYEAFSDKIFRLCKSYTNDDEWAKDLMQDTFIQVYLNIKKFRNESSIGTWVYRIASNICMRQMERALKEKNITSYLPEPKIEVQHDENDRHEQLYNCIAQLEKTERLIITMVLDGLSYKDIAEVLAVSEGNLRVKIHRIKRSLTEKFMEYEIEHDQKNIGHIKQ